MSQLRTLILQPAARLAELTATGEQVQAFLAQSALEESARHLLELGVVEALSNVMQYAFQTPEAQETASIRLLMADHGDYVEVVLSDNGEPIPAGALQNAPLFDSDPDASDLPSLPEGGFGLGIIAACADSVDYQSGPGGNHLTLIQRNG